MPTKQTQQVYADPGISRDGTQFDSTTYVAGQWVRFYKKRPQKIGGYLMLNQGNQQIPRSLILIRDDRKDNNFASDIDIYAGYQGYVQSKTDNQNIQINILVNDPPIPISLTLNIGSQVNPFSVKVTGIDKDNIPQTTILNYTGPGVQTQKTGTDYKSVASITLAPFSAKAPTDNLITTGTTIPDKLLPFVQTFYPQDFASDAVLVYRLNSDNNTTAPLATDRTPTLGPLYSADPRNPVNVWTFDTIFGSAGGPSLQSFQLNSNAKSINPKTPPLVSGATITIKLATAQNTNVQFPLQVTVSGLNNSSPPVSQTEILVYNTVADGTTGKTTVNLYTSLILASIQSAIATGPLNTITGSATVDQPSLTNLFGTNPTYTSILYAADSNLQNQELVLAHVAPTADSNSSPFTGPQPNSSIGQIYYGITQGYYPTYVPLSPMMQNGTMLAPGVTTRTDFQTADNGICVIGGYIFALNNSGVVKWNTALPYITTNNPFLTQYCANYWNPNSFFVMGSDDFIYGAPVRVGSDVGGLFWTASSLVRATRVSTNSQTVSTGILDNTTDPGLFTWVASYVSTITTCISALSICSYEPFFFWVGSDAFYQYNGAVSPVFNETNKEWFFDNLNPQEKAKITSFVNIQYHEWWILFPKGDATECNWALVYNIDYECWFDTSNINRASAFRSNERYQYPILGSSVRDVYAKGNFPIFAHEYGYDATYGTKNVYNLLSAYPAPIPLLEGEHNLPLNPGLPRQFDPTLILFSVQVVSTTVQLQIFGNNSQNFESLTFNNQTLPQQRTRVAYTSVQRINSIVTNLQIPLFQNQPIMGGGYLTLNPDIPSNFVPTKLSFTIDMGDSSKVTLTLTQSDLRQQTLTFIPDSTNPKAPVTMDTGTTLYTSLTTIYATSMLSQEITYNSSSINAVDTEIFKFQERCDPGIPLQFNSGSSFTFPPLDPQKTSNMKFERPFIQEINLNFDFVMNGIKNGKPFSQTLVARWTGSFIIATVSIPEDFGDVTLTNCYSIYDQVDSEKLPQITQFSSVVDASHISQLTQLPTVEVSLFYPILSFFTVLLSLEKDPPNTSNPITVDQVTLDLDQVGDMQVSVSKVPYPRASFPYSTKTYTFSETTQFLTMSENGTLILLTFSSHTTGGYYLMGKTLVKYIVSDSEREEPK